MQDNSAPVMSESEPKQKGLKGLKTGTIIAIIFGTVAVLSVAIIAVAMISKIFEHPSGKYVLVSVKQQNSDDELENFVEQAGTSALIINFKDSEKCKVYADIPQLFEMVGGYLEENSSFSSEKESECTYNKDRLILEKGSEEGVSFKYENGQVIIMNDNDYKLIFEKYYGPDFTTRLEDEAAAKEGE